MSDYIKREDAIQSIIAHDALKDFGDSREYAEWLLNKVPSADVAPVRHGRWVRSGEPPMYVVECSECGQKYFNSALQPLARYCSMCGAKMDGGDENA